MVHMGWAELREVSHFCFSFNLKMPTRIQVFGHQLFVPFSSQYGIKFNNISLFSYQKAQLPVAGQSSNLE